MTAVLDPDVLTGFHDGPVYYSAEDGRFYLLTDDGAIPADGPRYATTLDAAQLSMCGADHFTLRSDGTVDMMRPASPYTAAYEDTIMGMHFPGGLGLMGASGSSSLRKRLALNFLSGGSLDPRITFTRASSATRVNSSGLIETVSSDVARFDYDPVTLAAKGLLIEEQRTNLLLRSQEFDHSAWASGISTSVTANAVTSPAGDLTADTAVIGAGTILRQTVVVSNGTVYTFSAWVKASASGGAANIRLAVNNTLSWTGAVSTKVALTSSWQRIQVSWTANSTNAYLVIGRQDAAGAADATCDGNIDVWGAQLEAGSFQTSYIPTTSATVTRAADAASITGTNFSDWFNASEGTFVVEVIVPQSTGYRPILVASNGTGNERIDIGFSTNAPRLTVYNGGVAQADIVGSSLTLGSTTKIAVCYAANNFKIFCNGAQIGAGDTSGSLPVGLDRLEIGRRYDGFSLNSLLRRAVFYPSVLSDALLASLTA